MRPPKSDSSVLRYTFLYTIVLTTFFFSGLIVNCIQCCLYLTVRPISKYVFRKINYFLSYSFYSQMICMAEWYSNSDIYVHANENDFKKYFGKEHAFIVANHRYEIDWLFIGVLSEKVHCAGNFKAYMKKLIQYIPALGWCLFFSENIFLSRSFEKDKEIIQKQIKEIINFPDPMWLILFPEGTRFQKNKHEVSVELAKEKKLPLLKHHLNPRPKGFMTSLEPMKGKIAALYDLTLSINPIEYPKTTLLNTVLGNKIEAHIYIKRIPLEEIPDEDTKATDFLNEMFVQKDKLLDEFFSTGKYSESNGFSSRKLQKSYLTLLNSIFWYSVVMIPTFYCLGRIFVYSSVQTLFLIIGGISFIFFLFARTLDVNAVKKNSI